MNGTDTKESECSGSWEAREGEAEELYQGGTGPQEKATGRGEAEDQKGEVIFIYALKDSHGDVRYVGKTTSMEGRMHQHKYNPVFREFTGVVIRKSDPVNASRIEAQIIAAYKRKNKADGNKMFRQSVMWVETGKVFATVPQAALFFDCSEASIYSRLKNQKNAPFRVFTKLGTVALAAYPQCASVRPIQNDTETEDTIKRLAERYAWGHDFEAFFNGIMIAIKSRQKKR